MSLGPPYAPFLPDRIRLRLEVVETSPGVFCFLWRGPLWANGYGRLNRDGRAYLVHRVVYAASGRRLEAGLVLDHLCGVRACANVAHLRQVAQASNASTERSDRHPTWREGRCARGHDVADPANVMRRRNGRNGCRACHNERRRAPS